MEMSWFREGQWEEVERQRQKETERHRGRGRDRDRERRRDRDPGKMGFLFVKGWMVWRPDPMGGVCVCVCVCV